MACSMEDEDEDEVMDLDPGVRSRIDRKSAWVGEYFLPQIWLPLLPWAVIMQIMELHLRLCLNWSHHT